MKIYVSTQIDEQQHRQWWGDESPPAHDELLKLLPATEQGHALAVQGSARNVYLLALKLPGSASAYVLAAELEEPQARGLALATLLYQSELTRELMACLSAPQTTMMIMQTLETYMSRTPVRGEDPLFEGLDTTDAEEMIKCLRNKRFINGPGLKLLISERGAGADEEVDLQLRYGRRAHAAGEPTSGVEPKVIVAAGVVALLLLFGIFTFVNRPKTETVHETPAATPAQPDEQAASAPATDRREADTLPLENDEHENAGYNEEPVHETPAATHAQPDEQAASDPATDRREADTLLLENDEHE